MHALFIAERRAQPRHMSHSCQGIVRRWHANAIQQRDTARNRTKCSRNLCAVAKSTGEGIELLPIVRQALYRKS